MCLKRIMSKVLRFSRRIEKSQKAQEQMESTWERRRSHSQKDCAHHLRSRNSILSAAESTDKSEQWGDMACLYRGHSGCCVESN